MKSFKQFIESEKHLKFGSTLGSHADIKTKMPDADFWIVRRGDAKKVGTVTDEYNPEHIGVKNRNHNIDPSYLKYALQHVHNQGYFKQRTHGTLNLVNITTKHVKDIPIQSSPYSKLFEELFLEGIANELGHYNPSVAAIKGLAKSSKYKAVRFVSTKNGDLHVGDSEHFTHSDLCSKHGDWAHWGQVFYNPKHDTFHAYDDNAQYKHGKHPSPKIYQRFSEHGIKVDSA